MMGKILRLQETQHREANVRLHAKMSGLYAHHVTSLTPGIDTDDYEVAYVMWSGLQVWSTYKIVPEKCKFRRFSRTKIEAIINVPGWVSNRFSSNVASSGADNFAVNKGVLCVTVTRGKHNVRVVVMHPSPYVFFTGFQRVVMQNADTPASVAKTHKAQLGFAAGVIEKWLANTDGLTDPVFIAGDMNINRYAAEPETGEERAVDTAATCCSNEYVHMLKTLHADMPMIVPDANTDRWVATQPGAAELVMRYLRPGAGAAE